jgi:hypothetical protein
MVEVTLNIPDDTIKKIRALHILIGEPSAPIDDLIVTMVDKAVMTALVETVLGKEAYPEPDQAVPKRRAPVQQVFEDLTGISDGLGDDEPPEEAAPAPRQSHRAPPPKKTAPSALVSDEELLHELDVDDPHVEAKVEAPSFADQMADMPTAEEAFSAAADMPPPAYIPESTPRSRRASIDTRRVSSYMG